jgi:Icc-related predicted phosphoesterase
VGRWLFTSDLHGHAPYYEALIATVAARRPSIVILGGDLGPHAAGPDGPAVQRAFWEGAFRDSARRLREAAPGTRLFLLMGNDDWAVNQDVLAAGEPAEWGLLHDRVHELGEEEGGLALAGLSFVPITPFAIKDWERWDTADAPPGERLEGVRSTRDGCAPVRFDPAERGATIADALDDLARRSDPARTVYVVHSPPYGTACDQIAGPRHVGSRALRAFLERHQPPWSLSGHIHEAPRVSGRFHDRVGRTRVVNPGQFDAGKAWCAVLLDPLDPAGTLEHTVRGAG